MDITKKEFPKPKSYEGLSQHRMPHCYELVGKSFELVMDDGYDYTLTFLTREKLLFQKKGEDDKEYGYDCVKAEDYTYFVNLEMQKDINRTAYTFILDKEQSLVTWVTARMFLNPRIPRLPYTNIVFGAIKRDDGTIPAIRHGYTDEMAGKAVFWDYGTLKIGHVYYSERYYRVAFPKEAMERMRRQNRGNGSIMRSTDPTYDTYEDWLECIKIKDGLYVVSMTEYMLYFGPRNKGNNLLFLMNLNKVYDVGRSYGHNGDGELENYIFGAYGEFFDASETLEKKSSAYIK